MKVRGMNAILSRKTATLLPFCNSISVLQRRKSLLPLERTGRAVAYTKAGQF